MTESKNTAMGQHKKQIYNDTCIICFDRIPESRVYRNKRFCSHQCRTAYYRSQKCQK
jgi:predicted nucleic acid-binding Zn ribbon protein